jgi:hypothetical protein
VHPGVYGKKYDCRGVLERICETHGAAILRHKLANPQGCSSHLIEGVNEGVNALLQEMGTSSDFARQKYASSICRWAAAISIPNFLHIMLGYKKYEPDPFSLGITAAAIGDLAVVKKHCPTQMNHRKDVTEISNIIGAAVTNGHKYIVEFFLEEFKRNPIAGATDIFPKPILSDTLRKPIELAILSHQSEIGDLLYDFALHHSDQPCLDASILCHLDIVELCVKHDDMHTLHRAFELREHGTCSCEECYQEFVSYQLLMNHKEQVVCYLLQSGWLKPKDPKTEIPSMGFFSAMGYGRFETARILLEMGADVDEVPYRHKVFKEATTLWEAVEAPYLDTVKFLLEHSADSELVCYEG